MPLLHDHYLRKVCLPAELTLPSCEYHTLPSPHDSPICDRRLEDMVDYVIERWKGKCAVGAWYAHVFISEHTMVTSITITS